MLASIQPITWIEIHNNGNYVYPPPNHKLGISRKITVHKSSFGGYLIWELADGVLLRVYAKGNYCENAEFYFDTVANAKLWCDGDRLKILNELGVIRHKTGDKEDE
jgi:hypothetical protein